MSKIDLKTEKLNMSRGNTEQKSRDGKKIQSISW